MPEDTMTPAAMVRPLGPGEVFSSSRHALGIYRRLANTCRYHVPSNFDEPLDKTFETALAKVVLAQATLQVGIAEESSQKPYFVKLDTIDLRQHLEWNKVRHDMDLLHVLEDEQTKLFPNVVKQPPWKVVVVQSPDKHLLDITFLVHHAICDGKSTASFHQYLLQALIEPLQPLHELHNHILQLPMEIHMVPSMEDMIAFSASSMFLLKTLWQELAPRWLQPYAGPMPWTAGHFSIEPYQLHLRKFEFTAVQTERLIVECRICKTTLTGLLHALVLQSLSRRLPATDAATFRATTPISLTKLARPPANIDLNKSLFVAVTAHQHDFDPHIVKKIRESKSDSSPLLWQVAGNISKALKDRVKTLPKDDIVALLPWITDWQSFWTNKLGKPRAITWEVSNVGSLRYTANESHKQKDGWRIDRSIQTQPVMTTGAALSINAVGVVDGFLTISVGWQESIVDNDLANNVAKDLETWMSRISQPAAGMP